MLVGRVQTQEGKHRGQLQEDAGGTNLTMAACCSRKSFHNISYIGALNVSALHCSEARKVRVSGGGRGSADLPKIWSRGQKLHVVVVSHKYQSNGNDHLPNFNTLETTCLHSHT